jgi:hypothetical protein
MRSTVNLSTEIISALYDEVVRKALCVQIVVGVFAMFVLDGGIMAKVVGVAVAAFWICASVIILRRPWNPTRADLEFIDWGFWPILAVAALRQLLS